MFVKRWIILVFILITVGIIGYFFWPRRVVSPLANVQFTEKSLEKYDFDNLAKLYERAPIKGARTTINPVGAGLVPAQIEILGKIKAVEDRRNALKIKDLKFDTREIRFKSDGKWISGMINMPSGATTRVARTLRMLKDGGVDFELRTTVVPGIHDEKIIKKMAEEIREMVGKEAIWWLQNFRGGKCLDKSYNKKRGFTEKELNRLKIKAEGIIKGVKIRE